MERGELNVNMPQVNRHLSYVEGAMNRVAGALIFAVFLLSGVLLRNSGALSLSNVFWGLSFLALIWTIFFRAVIPPGVGFLNTKDTTNTKLSLYARVPFAFKF